MASTSTLCMNPGPIEFDNEVLEAIAHKGISHVDKEFLEIFGSTLEMMRKVFLAEDGQPLVVAGSGTLGWDLVAGNLISPGDEILIISTGYFSDNFGECLTLYGAKITYLTSSKIGSQPSIEIFCDALKQEKKFKAVIATHVDTSTGVAIKLKEIASCLRLQQPQALLIVDGVCALGGEECRMKEWDLDIVLTASQKCIGVPVGLSLLMIRPRALEVYNKKTSGFCSYYCDWKNWLPIMKNYEARSPSYFATPPVSHIYALQKSLSLLLRNGGMEQRFQEHLQAAEALRSALSVFNCELLTDEGCYASTLTCVRYPKGVVGAEFLPRMAELGVSVSGGLHKDVKTEYFRIGHMGLSTRNTSHIVATVTALEQALLDCGHHVEKGKAIKTLAKLRTGFSVKRLSSSYIKTLKPSKDKLATVALLLAALLSGYLVGKRHTTLTSLKS